MEEKIPQQPNKGTLPQPVLNDAAAHNQQPISTAQHMPPMTSQQQVSQPPIANAQDVDTIEPEWVARVNALIRQTINDPHVMVQEFEKLKAQYIVSRYGKEVKQSSKEG